MWFGLVLTLVATTVAGCSTTTGGHIADSVPEFLGGMPPDVPPRRGSPDYEQWQAKRAQEAARPKGKDAAQ
jgi:hypothetical protein